MNELISSLVFGQALGAMIGACTAVWSEIAYVRALLDGKIDHAEKAHLQSIGRGLRFGMSLVLFSSIGLIVVAYVVRAAPQPVLTPSYWILIAMIFLILGASWSLSRKYLSFMVASAVVFTAWWFLVYLTFGQLPTTSFGSTIAFFAVATALISIVLHGSRRLIGVHK